MSITYLTEQKDNYLIIKAKGLITNLKEEEEHSKRCYDEVLKHKAKKVLIDNRNIIFNSSILDVADLITFYEKEFTAEIRLVKIAVLYSPKKIELHKSWELFANNRGFNWKIFTGIDDATQYLLTE